MVNDGRKIAAWRRPLAAAPHDVPAVDGRDCEEGGVQWTTAFATGVAYLDEQHKRLFAMSEDYRVTLEEGRGAGVYVIMLDSLERYARHHFGREEDCMFRHACPAAAANGQAHRQFLEALGGFRQRYGERGFTAADARDLLEYVDGWLVSHIGRIDVTLQGCIEGATTP